MNSTLLKVYVVAVLTFLLYGQIKLLEEIRDAQFVPNTPQMCVKPLAPLPTKPHN